jgi:hypothetical protein
MADDPDCWHDFVIIDNERAYNHFSLSHALINCPKANALHALAKQYHDETEAFDRAVCSGPVVRGGIMPMTADERVKMIRNAKKVLVAIIKEAFEHGIGRSEMLRAIRDCQPNTPDQRGASARPVH